MRTLCPFPQRQVTRKPEVWASPPPHQSNWGKAPSRPLQVHTPPLAKMKIETRLGGNRTSASDSWSEAIDWARGGCGDHFGLFRASVWGQADYFPKLFYYSSKCFNKAPLFFFNALLYLQRAFIVFQWAFIYVKHFYIFSKHYSALALISRCVSTQFLDHISSLFFGLFWICFKC